MLAALCAALGAGPARAGGDEPWEHPFEADPRELVKAAAAAVAGEEEAEEDVVILLEEGRYVFDAEGRCDYRYRMVLRLQTEAGVKDWASLETTWAPWFEQRPEFRARVSTPDGQVHVLDPRTIAEAPVTDDDPQIYSDRRRLRAPLPGVAVGAVVEEEIRTPDRLPLFAAGTNYRFYVGNSMPVRRSRAVIEAPATLPLHHVLRGLGGLEVKRETADGRVRLTLETGPLRGLKAAEPWMPTDHPRRPYLAFSTGSTWSAVATAYSRIVDTQLAVPAVSTLRAGVRREEVARRLLKRLHEKVRYTGVEFGEAGLVPRSPAEVLSRGYGDCKDKSALLVSQLRQEGIPAFMALLSSGAGADVEPELPGLGSFDHAIVVLPGQPELWIDTTDEFARVGELPLGDQDRLALVASAETTALVRTPVADSSANVLRKTREYLLAESGPGRVIETTHATGHLERVYRSYYAETPPKDVRESQQQYASAEHESAAVVKAENSNPRDLSTPFVLRVESTGARRGETNGTTSTVFINSDGLFTRLPDSVGALPEDGGTTVPRQEKFVMPEPHRVEWTYRIVPPKGFVVRSLPEPVKETLGPASLEMRFTAGPEAIEGVLVFDSGPRLVEPSAFDALQEKVRAWRARDMLSVELEHKAQALLESGHTCEGLNELRLAAEAESKRAGPRERLAEGLLEAGFGEAAREEARRAVASEPTSSTAQRTLGWVLEHDVLGRRLKPGADRAGAEAAYRKAKELDSSNALARSSLAILLEHDEMGTHFGEGARLAEAVGEEESLRKDLEYAQLDVNLMLSLMHLRRFEELEKLARSLPPTKERNELLVVAAAAQHGAPAAQEEAARLFPVASERRDALLHAGNSLVSLRLYPAAAALLSASVPGSADAAARRGRADIFARVKRYEEMTFDAADPRTAVKRLVIALGEYLAGVGEPLAMFDYAAMGEEVRTDIKDHLDALRRGVLIGLRSAGDVKFSRDLVDLIVSLGEFALEGDAQGGYRAQLRAGGRSYPYYVVVRDGRPQVLVDRPTEEVMALEAWRLFQAGDQARGWRWLDWVRDGMSDVQPRDPLGRDPFLGLWRPPATRTVDEGKAAAASLFRGGPALAEGIQLLNARRAAVPEGAERRAVELALVLLYVRAERPADVLPLAESLAAAFPESETAFGLRVEALSHLSRAADARSAVEERLRADPRDESALRMQASLADRSGRYDDAEQAFARLAELGHAASTDLNNRAWNAVLRGVVDDTVADWARRGALEGPGRNAGLHTLATVYAEKGRVKEAIEVLAQSVAASPQDEVRSQDWYVVGRVAESCGLLDVARRAYERVTPAGGESLNGPGVLAARALARVRGPGGKRRE